MPADIINVAFCGAGGVVMNHHVPALEAMPDRYRITGFYDVRPEREKELAGNRYRAYAQYDDLLSDEEVDLVVIATRPLTTHFPLAKQALHAQKHVIIEKPMAKTSAECDDLIALGRTTGKVLTVHHNRRLDLDFLALRDVIEKGKIGEARFIENRIAGNSYQPSDFEDWGVHLIDQALVLNTSPLVEISAFLNHPAGGTLEGGYGEVTLRFEKPPVLRVSCLPRTGEYLQNGAGALPRFYAAGSSGSFTQRVIENPRDIMNATQNFDGWKPEYAVPDYLQIIQKTYYDYLYESLVAGAGLLVPPEEARNAIRVLEMTAESAKLNRTVPASKMI